MATLTGQRIKDSYKDLLQVSNSNSGIDSTLRTISDGEATDSVLQLSSVAVNISSAGALQYAGVAITSTAAELNILDGATITVAELNILDGVTSTAAELNILDGVTSTAAELNVLDGYTGSVTELNYLDTLHATGVTATEFDYLDGVTSSIQTQLDSKISATLTQEQVEDFVGGMLDGTETGISVSYDDTNGNIDFVVTSQTDENFTTADHSKLDGIEASATADQTASEIKTLVGNASDSNVFTDADHSKLDGIEASADVTDATNVTAAGALMDSEVSNLSFVKSLTKGISDGNVLTSNDAVADNDFLRIDGTEVEGRTAAQVRSDLNVEDGATADQTNAEIRTAVEAASDSNVFTDDDHSKLNAIEANADVTDSGNVTSAGALMDSELTSIADVKALDQSVVSGATPTFTTTNFTDSSNKRFMTDAQETKLDSVESNATADQTAEEIQDIVGAMFTTTNTETGITATYQDSTGDIDLVVQTLNQDTTGNAATATKIASITNSDIVQLTDTQTLSNKTIASPTFTGDVTFNDASTPQITITDTTNTAQLKLFATDTTTDIGSLSDHKVNFRYNNDIRLQLEDTKFMINAGSDDMDFTVKDASGLQALHVDAGDGDVNIRTLDVSGDADIDGTLEADAITVGGTALNTVIAGVTVANATLAATTTVSDSTANTNFPVVFHDESNALLDDTGALRYNPSTGTLLVPNLSVAGTTTTVDTVTMQAANAIIFEGATADANETTLSIVDPTGDRTINLPNVSGTIPVLAAASTTQISSTPEELNILDGKAFLDEDDLSSNSATGIASQQSIKAYVDGEITSAGAGDITAVTAGSGLTGGATSGAATLNIGAGTGIDVATDAISVDVSDFMANGANNYVLTATGADAMNAEANLTFDGTDLAIAATGKIYFDGAGNSYIHESSADSVYMVVGGQNVMRFYETSDVGYAYVPDSGFVGAGNSIDFTFSHDGSNSQIVNNTGHLYIRNNADDADIIFQSDDDSGGTENYIQIDGSEGRTLFNKAIRVNDSVRIGVGSSADLHLEHDATNTYISNQTGDLYIQNQANDKDIIFRSDDMSGGVTEYFRFDGASGYAIASKLIRYQDSVKAMFGTGGDFAIQHDGSNTYMTNSVTGHLYIQQGVDDADIVLQSDDGSGGVTAYITLDGGLGYNTVQKHMRFDDAAQLYLGTGADLQIYHDGTNSVINNLTGDLQIYQNLDDKDIVLLCDDVSGVTTAYLTLDGSATTVEIAKNTNFAADVDVDGTLETDALTINGVTLAETISDTVGAMVGSNTESGITVAYQDADNTLDFTVGTLNQDTTGNAATATALATARNIHGVSFDGTGNIDLSEVIQDTVGAMFSSNTETRITATYQDGDGTIDLVVDDLDTDTQLSTENVQDIAGGMFSGNTETGITAGYVDGDGTIDLTVDYLPATDDRDVKPNAITTSGVKQVRAYFTTLEGLTGSSGSDYQDLLVLDTYSDGSGGDMNALAFDKSTQNIYHYLADQSDSTWGTAKRIAYIENGSNNRVMTASSSSTVNGEGNLTFDGTNLTVAHSSGAVIFAAAHAADKIQLYSGGNEKIGTEANTLLFTADNFKFKDVAGTTNVTFNDSGQIAAASLDISGDVDVDGTLETDALTINGTTSVAFTSSDHSKLDGIASGATANTGDITAVVAGTGLSGGSTSGSATLNLNVGDLGLVGNGSLDSATNTEAEYAALPVGYAKMMHSNLGTDEGMPLDSQYFYFKKIANRDSGGGWGAIALGYNNNEQFYIGNTTVSSAFATWSRVVVEDSNGIATSPVQKITSGDDFALGELTNNLRMKGNSTTGFNFLNSGNGWAHLNCGNVVAAGSVSIGGHAMADIDIGSEFTDTDDHLMSSGAIKEKIEDYGYTTNTGDITAVTVTAGTGLTGGGAASSGAYSETLNVIGGDGITANANDVAITAAQTTITSVKNASLVVGRDSHNGIHFSTDNAIKVEVNDVQDEFRFASGGTFHADADIIAYSSTTASDKRLKENIEELPYGLDDVMKMKPVQFDWKKDEANGKERGHDIGVIAQEMEEIVPEVVKEYEGLQGKDDFKAVDYSKIVPVLIKSIQELKEEIEELKK